MTDSRPSPRVFGLLLALALPVLFLWLGANSIWDANEAFYVDTPRHMVRTGDYVTPMFNGAERLNKPVLSYWIVAGLYRAFGTSVAVERTGIEWQGRELSLTISIGMAAWRGEDMEPADLLARADKALYSAKHDGRNCVRAASAYAG